MAVLMVLFIFIHGALSCSSDDCGDTLCKAVKAGNKCYYVIYEKATYEESRSICKSMDMNMMTIKTESDDVILEFPDWFIPVMGVWLDAQAAILPEWTFVNGFQYHISEKDASKCGVIYSRTVSTAGSQQVRYMFVAAPCYEPKSFLCRKDNCEPLDISCVTRPSNQQATWFQAREYCRKHGGDLFYLLPTETREEVGEILGYYHHGVGKMFVGFRKKTWLWKDSEEMLYTRWKAGEPRGYKDCVTLQHDSLWDDHDCDVTGPYIMCSRDL